LLFICKIYGELIGVYSVICRETHFWYVVPAEVKDDSLLSQYVEILSPCERRSILQMNEDRVQKSALLARALVRTTLARCMSQITWYYLVSSGNLHITRVYYICSVLLYSTIFSNLI